LFQEQETDRCRSNGVAFFALLILNTKIATAITGLNFCAGDINLRVVGAAPTPFTKIFILP